MNLAQKLKKIAVKLEILSNSLFCYPVEKQKRYIAHFPEPEDDIQRSYFQYRCQMKLNNWFVSFAINLVSFPLLFFYLLKKVDALKSDKEHVSALFFSDGKPENIIPEILRKNVGKIDVVTEKKESLTKKDKSFIKRVWKRYPFSFHFVLKSLLKIRFYSYAIQENYPQTIIVCNEYSFTSSVLTKYCEEQGIRFINVMHGEKLYYMRDSFFHFHECYVWDDFYKELFIKMRAEPNQFKIAVPQSLKFIENEIVQKTVDYTYYLGAERGNVLICIVNIMEKLRIQGLSVAIRPHPRYSDIDEIRRVSSMIEIEDCKAMTIEQSLKRTKNAISVYSTVLNQAFNNDIGIVIDDLSDKMKYDLLNERMYCMMNKTHKLLSQLVA